MPDFTDIMELDPNKNYYIRFPSDLSDEEIQNLKDRFEEVWQQKMRESGWTGSIIFAPDNIEISDAKPD